MKKYIFALAFISYASFGGDLGNEVDALKAANHFQEVIDLLEGIDEVQERIERADHQSFQVTFSYKKHFLGLLGPQFGPTLVLVKVLARKSTHYGTRFIKYDVIDVQKKSLKASSRKVAALADFED